MQPFYRYPNQPQHPMQPFQVNPYIHNMQGMPGMNHMPRQIGSVDRFLGTIGSGGSVTGGTNVFTMLNNVQKVLKVAETMGPMIKQYGPAMRNLPSIMTALKEFQSGSSKKADNDAEADTSETAEMNPEKKESKEKTEPKKKEKKKPDSDEKVVVSGPKSSKASIQPETAPKSKIASPAAKAIPSPPKSNVPKGYQRQGPKLYV